MVEEVSCAANGLVKVCHDLLEESSLLEEVKPVRVSSWGTLTWTPTLASAWRVETWSGTSSWTCAWREVTETWRV